MEEKTEKNEEEKKDRMMMYAYIGLGIIVVGLVLFVIFVDKGDVEIGNIFEPVEEPPKTQVLFTCIRTNNTPCVMDGTCPNYEEHTFNINETDYLDGEFMWYNNSWCEIEWR